MKIIRAFIIVALTVLSIISCTNTFVATGEAGEYCREMQRLWDKAEKTAERTSEMLNRRVDDSTLYMDEGWKKNTRDLLNQHLDDVKAMGRLTPPWDGRELRDKAQSVGRYETLFNYAVISGLGNPPNLLDQYRWESVLWNLKEPTEEFLAEFREYCGWDINP